MTRQDHGTPIEQMLSTLADEGFEGLAEAIGLLLNEAMKIERSAFLGAGPYERCESRRGHANGFKDKHLRKCLYRDLLLTTITRSYSKENFDRFLAIKITELTFTRDCNFSTLTSFTSSASSSASPSASPSASSSGRKPTAA